MTAISLSAAYGVEGRSETPKVSVFEEFTAWPVGRAEWETERERERERVNERERERKREREKEGGEILSLHTVWTWQLPVA
jgi:hypothetical protein